MTLRGRGAVAVRSAARIVGVGVVGAGLLRATMASPPASRRFYVLGNVTAAVWASPLLVGRGHPGPLPELPTWRTAAGSVGLGVAAFGIVYAGARVTRRIPVVAEAAANAVRHRADNPGAAVAITLVNGVAEELYFRGALFDGVDRRHAVTVTSASYALATAATGNAALTLASAVVGPVLGWQRQRTDDLTGPVITHLTWSALSLWLVPPLYLPTRRESGGGR